MAQPRYEHTQHGWPMRVALVLTGTFLLVMSALPAHSQEFTPAFVAGVLLVLALGWAWSSLKVRVDDGGLRLQFGLGFPRRTVRLADIASAEVTRTTFWQGWGVRLTRRGWLYNVSGFDAVLVRRTDGKAFLVGTDEPGRLKAALDRAMTHARLP